ncbi:peptidylprolyl isomerase [Flavobacterium akiainvivens]|uniref:Peptidylprolyl isomerase n=1 Tax=Flavobacterium akiainvivens TaxID=1202724 RepID=A0A0M9VGN5_9FLAO|nr:peptidylprolyl isomerase [Flavobacterium akiainvivens]KOS04652.1 peptidylprolyl isomerase [Flavobacterium akiainvivens]SFQ65406.1 peptidyl-prolyl cis-trans isomerase SurA [Flavobacterium akiainvivens]
MKLNKVLSGLLLTAVVLSGCKSSQDAAVKKDVLFTIDDKPYYTDEFVRVYKKNLNLVKDESQKDLDNYLDLFVGYKLKVNKAYKLGLNENKRYQGEFKSYRSQYAKNYMTDTVVTDELVKEAYDRSLKEIRASHILFTVDENALPADTLKAYNKAVEVRKRAVAGEDFAKLAGEASQDPSAKQNGGDLGYFSVFRMVYPFESGAFNTPKGEISQPVRSRFGYHIIKVTDVRDNRGDITVAHIMVMKPKKENAEEAAKAKAKINDIYKKLQQGEDFAELAKQFSDDKSSANSGGKLNKFSSGELTSTEFEDQAFALKNPGDITEPFESSFGWHIVKLVEKFPVPAFAQVKADYENRVKRDERSRLIETSVTEKIRKKYKSKKDKKVYDEAVATLTDSVYTGKWSLPENIEEYNNKTLLTINNDKQVTAKTFLTYVNAQQRVAAQTAKPVAAAAAAFYDKFEKEQLTEYYDAHLEQLYPEFGYTMDEYRDGLLLYDLMQKEIWDKSKNDTIGLQKFYDAHKADYQWKNRADAEVFSSTAEADVKQAREMLLKGQDVAAIKEKLNTKQKVSVMEKTGVYEQDSNAIPKAVVWKEGVSDVVKDGNYYYVVKINKLLPAGAKTLDEAKGRVINDYQQYLESTWVEDLKKESAVKVNQAVFEKVKKELNQK